MGLLSVRYLAAYPFIEHGEGDTGKRLHVTKVAEQLDPQKVPARRRRLVPVECGAEAEARYLVHFRVDRVRPLIGDGLGFRVKGERCGEEGCQHCASQGAAR